jgi:hypothetical protein
MKKHIWIICILFLGFILKNDEKIKKGLIEQILENDTSKLIAQMLQNPEHYKVQIIYTQIKRDENYNILLENHYYRTGLNEYFYPASLVKLPVAALTLEKIKALNIRDSLQNLYILDQYNGKTNIADAIEKLFVVSNNSVFNTLYDFVGQRDINNRLWEMGFTESRIIQKFLNGDSLAHRRSFPVVLVNERGDTLYRRDTITNPSQWYNKAKHNRIGKGYFEKRKLIRQPKDFSTSNYLPLADLHTMLIGVIYPEAIQQEKRFNIRKEDGDFLRRCMSMYPRESNNPEWKDTTVYYDSFRKYFMFGESSANIDSSLRIFNKVGQAYGFMGDCAYIVDYKNNIEYFISAVIYGNKDEILNDGKYDYHTVGYPFFTRVGNLIYNYELNRSRNTVTTGNE